MHATKRVSWQSKSVIVPTCSQGTAGAVQRERSEGACRGSVQRESAEGRVQREGAERGCAHRGVDTERVEAGQVCGGAEGEGDGIRHLRAWCHRMEPYGRRMGMGTRTAVWVHRVAAEGA